MRFCYKVVKGSDVPIFLPNGLVIDNGHIISGLEFLQGGIGFRRVPSVEWAQGNNTEPPVLDVVQPRFHA